MNTTTLAFGQKLGMFPGISYGAPMAAGFSSEEDGVLRRRGERGDARA